MSARCLVIVTRSYNSDDIARNKRRDHDFLSHCPMSRLLCFGAHPICIAAVALSAV